MKFGESEIQVTACDKASGKECVVRLTFLDRGLSLVNKAVGMAPTPAFAP